MAHRVKRLHHLILTDYGPEWEGAQARFLRANTKPDGKPVINQGLLSLILAGKKSFGEEMSENLAVALGLDSNWFESDMPTPKEGYKQIKRSNGLALICSSHLQMKK